MEQIIVRVKDKEKARVLVELLAALDFVDSVASQESAEERANTGNSDGDFFALAGLW